MSEIVEIHEHKSICRHSFCIYVDAWLPGEDVAIQLEVPIYRDGEEPDVGDVSTSYPFSPDGAEAMGLTLIRLAAEMRAATPTEGGMKPGPSGCSAPDTKD